MLLCLLIEIYYFIKEMDTRTRRCLLYKVHEHCFYQDILHKIALHNIFRMIAKACDMKL